MNNYGRILKLALVIIFMTAGVQVRAGWTSESVNMIVGESRTLTLPYSVRSLRINGGGFYAASPEYVDIEYSSMTSVRVIAKKALSTPVIVRYDYSYLVLRDGKYVYGGTGAHDFKITVSGSPDDSSGGGSSSGSGSGSGGTTGGGSSSGGGSDSGGSSSGSGSGSGGTTGGGSSSGSGSGSGGTTGGGSSSGSVQGPTSISIPSSLMVEMGENKSLKVTVSPIGLDPALSWRSSNTNVASVTNEGIVKGVDAGTATITVTASNGKYSTCKVTVTRPALKKISVPETVKIIKGYSSALEVTPVPLDATFTGSWESSNSEVASITANGQISAKEIGSATVTYTTAEGFKATCVVSVIEAPEDLDKNGLSSALSRINSLIGKTINVTF